MHVSLWAEVFLEPRRRLWWVDQVAIGLLGASLSALVILLRSSLVVGSIHHGFLVALLLFRSMTIEGAHMIGLLDRSLPVPCGLIH